MCLVLSLVCLSIFTLVLIKHSFSDGLGTVKKFWCEHLGELSCLLLGWILMVRIGRDGNEKLMAYFCYANF